MSGRAQADWKREADTVTQLQHQLAVMSDQVARSQSTDGKAAALREKLAASQATVGELRTRVRQLEDHCDRRDALAKDWSLSVGGFEAEVRRLADDNQLLVRDLEAVKTALAEVRLFELDCRGVRRQRRRRPSRRYERVAGHGQAAGQSGGRASRAADGSRQSAGERRGGRVAAGGSRAAAEQERAADA